MPGRAELELSAGIPFVSDSDLNASLEEAGVPPTTATAIVDENARAGPTGSGPRSPCWLLALVALAFTHRLPVEQPHDAAAPAGRVEGEGDGEVASELLRPAGA